MIGMMGMMGMIGMIMTVVTMMMGMIMFSSWPPGSPPLCFVVSSLASDFESPSVYKFVIGDCE